MMHRQLNYTLGRMYRRQYRQEFNDYAAADRAVDALTRTADCIARHPVRRLKMLDRLRRKRVVSRSRRRLSDFQSELRIFAPRDLMP